MKGLEQMKQLELEEKLENIGLSFEVEDYKKRIWNLTTPTQQATGVLYSEFLLIVHEVSSLKGMKLRFGKNNTLYYSVHSLRPELGTDKEY